MMAQKGPRSICYRRSELRELPIDQVREYFLKEGNGTYGWTLKEEKDWEEKEKGDGQLPGRRPVEVMFRKIRLAGIISTVCY